MHEYTSGRLFPSQSNAVGKYLTTWCRANSTIPETAFTQNRYSFKKKKKKLGKVNIQQHNSVNDIENRYIETNNKSCN